MLLLGYLEPHLLKLAVNISKLRYILLDIIVLNGSCCEFAYKFYPGISCVDFIFSFYYYSELCSIFFIFVNFCFNGLASGWFNTSQEYIEERFAFNFLYLLLVVVSNIYKVDYLLIDEDVFGLDS